VRGDVIRNILGQLGALPSIANGIAAWDRGALYWPNTLVKNSWVLDYTYGKGDGSYDPKLDASRVVPVGAENAPQTKSDRWYRRVV